MREPISDADAQAIARAALDARDEALRKAWNALGGYKFSQFGYWCAAWVKFNALMPASMKHPSPFKALVKAARAHVIGEGWPCPAHWRAGRGKRAA